MPWHAINIHIRNPFSLTNWIRITFLFSVFNVLKKKVMTWHWDFSLSFLLHCLQHNSVHGCILEFNKSQSPIGFKFVDQKPTVKIGWQWHQQWEMVSLFFNRLSLMSLLKNWILILALKRRMKTVQELSIFAANNCLHKGSKCYSGSHQRESFRLD